MLLLLLHISIIMYIILSLRIT